MNAGQAPFVGEVAVSETEYLLRPADAGGTGEVYAHSVPVLILRQYLIYSNTHKLSGFITEPEPHRCDPSVRIGAGDHLHRYVNAQNTFQNKSSFL